MLLEIRRRFRLLKGRIVKLVAVEDAFGMAPKTSILNCAPGQLRGADGRCGPGIGADVPRDQMPQIRSRHFQDFLDYARERGVLISPDHVKADDLSPAQSEFRQDRVDDLPDSSFGLSVLISKDNYVLDGTHRWVKHWQRNKDGQVPVLRIDLDLHDALDLMREFPEAQFVDNAFCPTGLGGGVDSSCSPSGGGGIGTRLSQAAIGKVKAAYSKFSDRYGRRGAIAMMAAMAVTMPLPGNFMAVIGIAEGVRAASKLLGNESHGISDDMLDDVRQLAEELGLEFDADRFAEEYRKQLTENSFCPTGQGGGVDPTCSPGLSNDPKYNLPKEEGYSEARGKSFEYSINPSKSQLGKMVKKYGGVRGLADAHRVLVWPGDSAFHKDVSNVLGGVGVKGFTIERDDVGFFMETHDIGGKVKGDWEVSWADSHPYFKGLGASTSSKPEGMGIVTTTTQLTLNAGRWQFEVDSRKIEEFQRWLREQYGSLLTGKTEEELWKLYAEAGFRKGAGRAFDDVRQKQLRETRPDLYTRERQESVRDFYAGTRDEFLRSSFGRPETVEKLQLLAGRSFDDLENVTSDMSTRMSRVLMDGLARGENPRTIADSLVDEVDISEERAEMIARTEIIRAHAEGQLDSMEAMGIDEVGVAVEWSTAGDLRVCPKCSALEGIVLKVDESHGLIPRHPNCRCAFIPANVGEDESKQKRTKEEIEDAIEESVSYEKESDWAGADLEVDADRPKSPLSNDLRELDRILNSFCPTGPGGGIDPSCSPGSESSVPPPKETEGGGDIQQSYIDDAAKIASLEFVQRRVDRVASKLEENDARWSKVQEKIAKKGEQLEKLGNAHSKEVDKLTKMMDKELDALKSGASNPYAPGEINTQAEKVDAALGKYMKFRREMTEKSWSEIRKHVNSDDTKFETGTAAIAKISLGRNRSGDSTRDLSGMQNHTIQEVEKRMAGCITGNLRQRIDETDVRSVREGEEQRAYFKGTRHNGDAQSIYLPGRANEETVAHELGHSLETNGNVHAAAQGFLYMRVGREEAKPMGEGFRRWEVGRDDDFGRAFGASARYVGKHYKTDDTEITSMGLERLYSDPVHFARSDPRYFKFMLGILDGTFS